jgi:nucleoid DNA-binding protein
MANNKLNKEDLIVAVAGAGNVTKTEAENQINNVFDGLQNILDGMEDGDKLQLVGLITVEVVNKPEHQAKNPLNGNAVTVPAQNKVKIKAGKKLIDAVN